VIDDFDSEPLDEFNEDLVPVTCENRLGGPDGLVAAHRGGNMKRRHGVPDEERVRSVPDEPPPGWAEP